MPSSQPAAAHDATVEIILNGQPRKIRAGDSVADLLAALELPHRAVAVEVNDLVVPRAEHAARRLSAGDRLEVVTLVGGG